ncbi:MAG: glucosamine-6-phosphate deaminase [Spirochaetia bacterium]
MQLHTFQGKDELGAAAATAGAEQIRVDIERHGKANIVLATGASQFDTLSALVRSTAIDWSKVTVFHLDEYIGIGPNHPASFRRYLRERFADKVGPLADFHYIAGDTESPDAEARRLAQLIDHRDICVAFIGIGENGHLAFNDPPADFTTTAPYIVVDLDEQCRQQQMGEGWFDSFHAVPTRAISMSVNQIMKARTLIVSVPDERKAKAVHCAVEGPITPECPASMLQRHPDCRLYLDTESAVLVE